MKMMVLIGSVPTAAHRGQLRISKTGESHEKPNVLLRRQQLEFHEDGGEFRGFRKRKLREPSHATVNKQCPAREATYWCASERWYQKPTLKSFEVLRKMSDAVGSGECWWRKRRKKLRGRLIAFRDDLNGSGELTLTVITYT
nr:uncharacterized protein LOC109433146 [Aedes albopictus]